MSPSRPTPRTAAAAVVTALVAAALAPVAAASAVTPDGAPVEAVLAAAVPVVEVDEAPADEAPADEAQGPEAQGAVVVDVLRADGGVATVAAADAAAADELADELAEQPGVVAADVATTYALTGELAPAADLGPVGLGPADLGAAGAAAAGDAVAWHLDDVRAPAAWRTTTGAGRVVAVLDSPVDAAHPDLAGALLPEVDLVVGEGSSDHGTFVTSLVVGRSAPGRATTGVAPSARVLPVEVCGADGCTSSAVAEGVRRAVAAGADVINLSLAGRTRSTVVESAVRSALAAGVVVVAASGNDGAPCTATAPTACGNPVMYPAAVPGVVAVAASDASGRSAPWAVHGPQVALTAPGAGVVAHVQSDVVSRESPEDQNIRLQNKIKEKLKQHRDSPYPLVIIIAVEQVFSTHQKNRTIAIRGNEIDTTAVHRLIAGKAAVMLVFKEIDNKGITYQRMILSDKFFHAGLTAKLEALDLQVRYLPVKGSNVIKSKV